MANLETKDVEREIHILIIGGKRDINQKVIAFESAQTQRRKLSFVSTVLEAFALLRQEQVDLIVIEAFMDNCSHETPFDFLQARKESPYAVNPPVTVVAMEPSHVGLFLTRTVRAAARSLGAHFVLIQQYDPERTFLQTIA